MTTRKAIDGKPYAWNPHCTIAVFPLLCVVCLSAQMLGAVGVSGDSSPITVDTTVGDAKCSSSTASLAFDPLYSAKTPGSASYVVLKKVVGFETGGATTSVVTTCAADASGVYPFAHSSSDPYRIRFLHVAYDSNDVQVGETLAQDVAFPLATAGGNDEILVDGRTNSLQICATEALEAETVVSLPFAYDSKWPTDGEPAFFRLTQVCDSVNRAMEVLSSSTNVLLESEMPAVGNYSYTLNPYKGGRYTFYCTFFDSSSNVVGRAYSASYYLKEKRGFLLIVQ